MRCKFFEVSNHNRASIVLAAIATTGLIAAIVCGSAATAQQTARCALVAPKFQAKDANVTLEITIDCEARPPHSKPFPINSDMLVGLTVYSDNDAEEDFDRAAIIERKIDAAPAIRTALNGAVKSRSVTVARAPKWIILVDSKADSFDFPAQVVRLTPTTKRMTLQFQAREQDIAGKQHLLFAVWPAAQRKPCDRANEYARSGCKRDGYVIGDNDGVKPIAAYPGLESLETETRNTERWIVERFR